MKASELITKLQSLIESDGDMQMAMFIYGPMDVLKVVTDVEVSGVTLNNRSIEDEDLASLFDREQHDADDFTLNYFTFATKTVGESEGE